MSEPEIDYLVVAYQKMKRDPTDAELVHVLAGQLRALPSQNF